MISTGLKLMLSILVRNFLMILSIFTRLLLELGMSLIDKKLLEKLTNFLERVVGSVYLNSLMSKFQF